MDLTLAVELLVAMSEVEEYKRTLSRLPGIILELDSTNSSVQCLEETQMKILLIGTQFECVLGLSLYCSLVFEQFQLLMLQTVWLWLYFVWWNRALIQLGICSFSDIMQLQGLLCKLDIQFVRTLCYVQIPIEVLTHGIKKNDRIRTQDITKIT